MMVDRKKRKKRKNVKNQTNHTSNNKKITLTNVYLHITIIRSTTPSRPNNIRGGNVRPSVGTSVRPSVRTYVCPQKVCQISMKFGVYIVVDE